MTTTNPAPAQDTAAPAPASTPAAPRVDLRERPELLMIPAVFVVIMLLWQFLPGPLGVKEYVLPLPTQIADRFVDQLKVPEFWHNVWVTSQEALLGFAIATVAAIVLGTLIAQVRLVERTVLPYVVAFQTIPKVALAPLFVIWFGFGITSKVVMATIIAFFPILINVIAGLKSADNDKIEMLTSFGASRFQIFRMARLPSALPYIFAGLDIGIVFAILGAIVGEYIGAQEGLGYQLMQANYNFDTPGLFAVLIVLSIMGMLAHSIIKLAQRRIVFWSADRLNTGA